MGRTPLFVETTADLISYRTKRNETKQFSWDTKKVLKKN